ncbi:nicotinate phosphoribosyltransferase [Candidatus Uabimicrobium amorphum]|uniref:Nicotinate phosphoribosyltransferase n=1 Tax=Uabimicrobium amorphum TaxID=2596890 RepID=A0A5S9F2K9_UABAM|nr:nicotinate phosphoribosyltransferase [Candidatus Uabimicrobium amorphum]BBM83558.1 nicotinate phosphoribosyltransferase [Candidatus Uabimicrobium amorphum]
MTNSNTIVGPLLTDLYQLTMVYGYWCHNKWNMPAVFDLHFRKNPFKGEFTIFAGLAEVLNFTANFRFTDNDIAYLKEQNFFGKNPNPQFFEWLKTLDCSKVKIYALHEGSLAFPREPLLRVEGPLAIVQLMETTLLNLVNYASLMATNAARFRLAAGHDKSLLEFGLRRAQGPDGGISASRYAYLGGFDGTSNVLAGKLFSIPVKGTNAHSFISSFTGLDDLQTRHLQNSNGEKVDFVARVIEIKERLGYKTHEGELAAFIAYAISYPHNFLALVDTYDTLHSGVLNFIVVALALVDFGYRPIGVRLDSGDLAYLSKETRKRFTEHGESLPKLTIIASNDINENTLVSLQQQQHQIDAFGIGTHLVTCQAQPALGGVYKLVELSGIPRMKLSQDVAKITLPGRKKVYRIIGKQGYPLLDLMTKEQDIVPQPGKKILCRHPFKSAKRVYVTPQQVVSLQECYWDGKLVKKLPSIHESRQYVLEQLAHFRPDHLRQLNPTPYKVSLSDDLYTFFHNLWEVEAPILEIT